MSKLCMMVVVAELLLIISKKITTNNNVKFTGAGFIGLLLPPDRSFFKKKESKLAEPVETISVERYERY